MLVLKSLFLGETAFLKFRGMHLTSFWTAPPGHFLPNKPFKVQISKYRFIFYISPDMYFLSYSVLIGGKKTSPFQSPHLITQQILISCLYVS